MDGGIDAVQRPGSEDKQDQRDPHSESLSKRQEFAGA